MPSVSGALALTKAFIQNWLNFNVIEQPIGFFTLPAEIRIAIYCQILVSKGPICEADRLVGDNMSVLLTECKPITDINSAILRTCRKVYTEALHVLYAQNTFHFSDPRAIARFQETSRFSKQTLSLNTRYDGRLTLIQFVSLDLTSKYIGSYSKDYRREHIWNVWLHSFFSEAQSFPPYGNGTAGFPALQKLRLDFTDWQLEADEGVRVSAFFLHLNGSNKPFYPTEAVIRLG